jgi:hypothetical protein
MWCKEILSLPMYPQMTNAQAQQVAELIAGWHKSGIQISGRETTPLKLKLSLATVWAEPVRKRSKEEAIISNTNARLSAIGISHSQIKATQHPKPANHASNSGYSIRPKVAVT